MDASVPEMSRLNKEQVHVHAYNVILNAHYHNHIKFNINLSLFMKSWPYPQATPSLFNVAYCKGKGPVH